MTNTALLEQCITNAGLKKNYIAQELGLSPYGLSNKINNRNEFKTSEIEKLCDILNISDLKTRDKIFFDRK